MICLDTQVLIWGVGGFDRATRGQEADVVRAERYIRFLRMKNIGIAVPTPVLAEYLVGATVQERREARIFEMAAEIWPFDVPAAEKAAELQRNVDSLKDIQTQFNKTRDQIKVDIMIVAIALYRRAEKIITCDGPLYKILSNNQADVAGLPDITSDDDQGSLFNE